MKGKQGPGRPHKSGVQLVPAGKGRALISLESRNAIPQLELDLRDALDRADVGPLERQTLEALAEILREGRLSRRVRLEERTIIVLESKRQRANVSVGGSGTAGSRRLRKRASAA